MASQQKPEPYFIHVYQLGTWQLLAGNGLPLTAPRRGADGPMGDAWRAEVLRRAKATGALVKSDGAWIGRIDERGEFRYCSGPNGEGGAA